MSKIQYMAPVETMTGRFSKRERNGAVFRQKVYRNSQGKIMHEGVKEGYVVKFPRDYSKHPAQGEELRTIQIFSQVVALSQMERHDPSRLAYWTSRWQAQREKGEESAPIDPLTHRHRTYQRLDMFIQAVLRRNIRAGKDPLDDCK